MKSLNMEASASKSCASSWQKEAISDLIRAGLSLEQANKVLEIIVRYREIIKNESVS